LAIFLAQRVLWRRSSAFRRDGIVPPTLNLENPARESVIDRVPLKAQKRKVDVALSNSFGFGGTNASIILKRCKD